MLVRSMLKVRNTSLRVRVAMDVLSEILATLRLEGYVSGGFVVGEAEGFRFPAHEGIKCYAVAAGSCWLQLDEEPLGIKLSLGDCVLLLHGPRFRLMTEPNQPCIDFPCGTQKRPAESSLDLKTNGCSIVGGHFVLARGSSDVLLRTLPPVSTAAALRMSGWRLWRFSEPTGRSLSWKPRLI